MRPFIYLFLFLAVFYLVGDLVLNLFSRISGTVVYAEKKLAMLTGAAAMLCVSQILCIFLSASVTAMIWWAVIVVYAVKKILTAKKSKCNLKQIIQDYWLLGLMTLVVFCILAYPMIRKNELLSYQYANNDIIYYLSTIDWFKGHSLLNPIEYTNARPYYCAAEYILQTTRFGVDVLGSVLSQMFALKAHEIYTFLGVVFVLLGGQAVYYICKEVLKISGGYSLGIAFIAMLHYTWRTFLLLQYVPQVAGVVFMTLFVFSLIDFFANGNRISKILTSLFLAATVSSYAEFSSYLFIIYIGIIIIQMIFEKKIWKTLKDALAIGVIGIVCNPLGFYVAVNFNLFILSRVKTAKASIDAYAGQIKSFWNIFTQLVGGPAMELCAIFPTREKIYKLLLLAGILISVLLLLYMLWKRRNKLMFFMLWILAFFVGYELYFREVRLAYEEYKHLTSIVCILLILLFYFVLQVDGKWKSRSLYILVFAGLACINIVSHRTTYKWDATIMYDSSVQEVDAGLEQVPETARIGLFGNAHHLQHQLIYAARNHEVQLMGDGINSYFPMLGIQLDNTIPEYILLLKESRKELKAFLGESYHYEKVWANKRFVLVKIT